MFTTFFTGHNYYQHQKLFERISGKVFPHGSKNQNKSFMVKHVFLKDFVPKIEYVTMHHWCSITCLWLSTSSASSNHETSIFPATNQISISGCSHAKKERTPMRNDPPPSPCILHTHDNHRLRNANGRAISHCNQAGCHNQAFIIQAGAVGHRQ